jgi:hypothetical protein
MGGGTRSGTSISQADEVRSHAIAWWPKGAFADENALRCDSMLGPGQLEDVLVMAAQASYDN